MITILNNIPEYKLIDVENAQITISKVSLQLNETQPAFNAGRSMRTMADMGRGKFRRMFDRHSVVYGY